MHLNQRVTTKLFKIVIISLFLSITTQANTQPSKGIDLITVTQQAEQLKAQADQLIKQGQYDQAEQLYQQGLKLLESNYPPEHQEVQQYLMDITSSYFVQIINDKKNIEDDYLNFHQLLDADPDKLQQYEQTREKSLSILKTAASFAERGLAAPENTSNFHDPVFLYFRHRHYGDLQLIYQAESNIYLKHGKYLYYARRYDEAEPILKTAIELAHKREENHQKAEYYADKVKEIDPESAKKVLFVLDKDYHRSLIDALLELVDLYQDQERNAEIGNLLLELDEIFINDNNADAGYLNRIASDYSWINSHDKAEFYFKKAMKNLSENPNKVSVQGLDLNKMTQRNSLVGLGNISLEKNRISMKDGDRKNTRKFYDDAEHYYQESLKFASEEENTLASSYTSLGLLYLENDEYQKALDSFVKALDIQEQRLQDKNNYQNQRAATWTRHRLAIIQGRLGNKEETERLYRLNLENPDNRLPPGEEGSKAFSLIGLAVLYAGKGDTAQGLHYARQAQQLFAEHDMADFSSKSHRPLVDLNILWVIQQSLANQVLTQPEAANEALLAMQRIHGDNRMQVLQKTAMKLAGDDPQIRGDLKKLWDAQTELQTVTSDYNASLAAAGEEAQSRSEQLATEQQELRHTVEYQDTTLRQTFPAYNRLIDPKPLTLQEVQQLLKPHEALVTWVLGNDVSKPAGQLVSHLLVIRPDRVKLIQLKDDQLTIKAALEQHLYALQNRHGTAPHDIPMNLNIAHNLYKALLAPAESELVGVEHIIAVPDDTLRALPLHTLLASAPNAADPTHPSNDDYANADWLLRHYAISYLPAVNSLAQLRSPDLQRASSGSERLPFLGFGDPLLDGGGGNILGQFDLFGRGTTRGVDSEFATDTSQLRGLQRLRNTAAELRLGATLLGADPDKVVFTGKMATESEVKRLSGEGVLAKADILAFATHAYAAAETDTEDASRRVNRLQPGLVMTPPAIGKPEDDGYINADEVANLNLNSDWVMLAACETAKASPHDTSGLSQLVRAFFIAGTRSVLATHWNVEDKSAHAIMEHLFGSIAQHPEAARAKALQEGMLAVATGAAKPEGNECGWFCSAAEWLGFRGHRYTSHPAYWGAFVVYGEGE